MQTNGWLFDLYPLGDRMVLWFITATGERLRLEDDFPYCLYLGGPQARLRALARALGQQGWVRRPIRPGARTSGPARRSRWWPWRSAYGLLPRLRHWLGALPARWTATTATWIWPPTTCTARRSLPCGWYDLEAQGGRLLRLNPLEDAFAGSFPCRPSPP